MRNKTREKQNKYIGKKYNDLTVVAFIGQDKYRQCLFDFKCICGETTTIPLSRAKNNHTKSCGCRNSRSSYKHGMHNSKFYNAWRGMFKRINLVSRSDYGGYGGRGIKICKRWNNFNNFKDDMYQEFVDHCRKNGGRYTSLDRTNNNGDYKPTNCRWATPRKQANNRRSSRLIKYRGITKTLTEWSREYNINPVTLRDRIYLLKWPIEKALTKKTHA